MTRAIIGMLLKLRLHILLPAFLKRTAHLCCSANKVKDLSHLSEIYCENDLKARNQAAEDMKRTKMFVAVLGSLTLFSHPCQPKMLAGSLLDT